jgi:acyl dehydratase
MPRLADVRAGTRIPDQEVVLDQAALVAYAGASGDLNPLHWDPAFAAEVSPTGGVIAHGMLAMAHVARIVTAWAGGPERVMRLSASFRAPCPVGSRVRLGGEVLAVDAEAATATVAVWAEVDGKGVVDRRRSRAVVRLDP